MGARNPDRRSRSKGAAAKSEPSVDPLVHFRAVVDTCSVRGWTSHLGFVASKKTKLEGRFVLEIRDAGELIAKASSGHAPPDGLERCGYKVKVSLDRSGRTDG